jgi:hypothetical protein
MDARASRTPTFGRGLGLPILFAIIALPGIAHETWIIVACGFGLLVTLLNDLKLAGFSLSWTGATGRAGCQSGSGHHTSRLDSEHGQGHGPGVTAGRALRTCARERALPALPSGRQRPVARYSVAAAAHALCARAHWHQCGRGPPGPPGGKVYWVAR